MMFNNENNRENNRDNNRITSEEYWREKMNAPMSDHEIPEGLLKKLIREGRL